MSNRTQIVAAKTDRELSFQSAEFKWESHELTEVHRFVLPTLERWVHQGNHHVILDLGCGNGALTNKLAQSGRCCVGADMSLSGIEIASKHHTAATFCVAPIDRLLPKDLHKRFDLVVAIEVIEHLLLPRQLFDRAREALKPGGELIVSTPFHGYWKNLAIALSGKFDSHWHPLRDYGHVKFFSPATLNRLFDEQGFEVKQVKRVGRIPTLARSMMMRGRLPNH